MHLGCKTWVGGANGTLFGDGTYSENIIADKTSEIPVSGGFTNSNFNAHGRCTYANLMNGVLQEPYGCDTPSDTGPFSLDINFSSATALTKIRFYNYANTERLKDFLVWAYISGAWQKVPLTAVSEGGVLRATDEGQVSNANGWVAAEFGVTIATSFRLEFLNTWGIGDNNAWLTEVKVYGPIQPQASYNLYGPDIAPSSTLSYSGSVNGGYTPSNVIDGNNNTGGSLFGGGEFFFTYATAKAIRRVGFGCNFGTGTQYPTLFYSDDGATWTPTNVSGVTVPVDATIRYWDVNDYGAHRYWKVGAGGYQFTTISFHELTVLQNCIVITRAATVAPDSTTGAAVYTAQNIVVDGGSLSPTTNCKGLIGFVSGSVRLLNGGRIHIDKLGKAGNFGNLTVLDLVPQSIKRKLKNELASFVVLGDGAAGAPSRSLTGTASYNGVAGSPAGSMQTGGGGEGGTRLGGLTLPSSRGGRGGPCCGGGGGGGLLSVTAGYSGTVTPDYGPGGAGVLDPADAAYNAMGGAGEPIGASVGNVGTNTLSTGAGGGLLMLFAPLLSIASGCVVSADGGNGAGSPAIAGTGAGSAGGGIVCIVTNAGGYSNNGTVRANGGTSAPASYGTGGAGGVGSVNTFTV